MDLKKIQLFALGMTCLLSTSCSQDGPLDTPVIPEDVTTVSMNVGQFPLPTGSSEIPAENEIRNIEAYLFQDGKLYRKLGELTHTEGSSYKMEIGKKDMGMIYFLANADALQTDDWVEGTTTEEQLKSLVSDQKLEAATPQVMAGNYNRTSEQTLPDVSLKRNVARIDLSVGTEKTKVKEVSIDHVAQSGYVFEQSSISTPAGAKKETVSKTFDTPVLTDQPALFYVYEQQNTELNVTVKVLFNEEERTLTAKLPSELRRNTIYTIKVSEINDNPEIEITVSAHVAEWEDGDEIPVGEGNE